MRIRWVNLLTMILAATLVSILEVHFGVASAWRLLVGVGIGVIWQTEWPVFVSKNDPDY